MSVELAALRELFKKHIPDPGHDFLSMDSKTLLEKHKGFFEELAGKTPRLNAAAVANVGCDLYTMPKEMAQLFGTAMATAFRYCMQASQKAKTGAKLTNATRTIYNARTGNTKWEEPEVKTEPEVKREHSPPPKKCKPERLVTRTLSSPSQVLALYKPAKQEQVFKIARKFLGIS